MNWINITALRSIK